MKKMQTKLGENTIKDKLTSILICIQ